MEARGEFIAFLDSDDTWSPEKLELQLAAIEQCGSKCGACTTDAFLKSNSGMNTTAFAVEGKSYTSEFGTDSEITKNLVKSFGNYWLSILLARKVAIQEAGGFDPQIPFAEDQDFHFRLSLVTTMCYVNRPLAVIDRSPSPAGSECRPWDRTEVRLAGVQAMYEKWLRRGSQLTPEIRDMIQHELRNVHSSWANWHLENFHYSKARGAVAAAIRYGIDSRLALKWLMTQIVPGIARQFTPRAKPYL